MTFRSVLLVVVVMASTLGCNGEDREPRASKRTSSATRESGDKDASRDKHREQDESEASEVETRDDDSDDAESMIETSSEGDDEEKPDDEAPRDEDAHADDNDDVDSKRASGEPAHADGKPAGDEPAQADGKRAGEDESQQAHTDPAVDIETQADGASPQNEQSDEQSTGGPAVPDSVPTPDAPAASDPIDVQPPAGSDDGMDGAVTPAPGPTYYQDAKPIIDAKCAICHTPGGIGPMPFTTYEEVKPFAGLMAFDIGADVMPPWLPSDPPGKFIGDRRLTPEQKNTLLDWIDAGALEGDPQNEAPALPIEGRRSLAQVDQSLQLVEPYEPPLGADEYRCFVMDWPHEATKYVTALEIVPGDRKLVHHAIVYYVKPDQAEAVRARDADDPLPGYQCFGGVGNAAWLSSYEPGGHADEIPGNVGFEIEPGALMVLQIHYNTQSGTGADASRIDFTLKDEVERVGDVHLIMDPRWPAGAMQIPMGEPDVIHAYTGRGSSLLSTQNYEIYWIDMHMHALGRSGLIGIVRANGDFEELLNIPAWDFGWQETFILREPVTLYPDDSLYVECHFDNTPENQMIIDGVRLPPRDVAWGDRTTDEMCLGNVLVAPVLAPPAPAGDDAGVP